MRRQGQSPAWAGLTVLLVAVSCTCRGSVVKVNAGLRVKRGQVAYLQKEDLQFDIPHQKDECKVEVVKNEPITQRVGELMPQVFDCHYVADEVKYVHHGCPLLKEDTVKLRLYRFTDSETYIEEFLLQVVIVEPDCSVIQLGPKSLTAADLYSLSDHLDHNVVSFHYERSSTLVCSIVLTSQDTYLPAHGQLVTGEPQGATSSSPDDRAGQMCDSKDCRTAVKRVKLSNFPCEDWPLMGLRYQHTDPHSPDVDYITIRLDLKDTRSGSIYKSEQAWIPVHIPGAQPNQPPKPFLMSSFILEVDEFILTPLSTATLDAEDHENPQKFLVFNITKPPAKGFITHLSDHTRPVSSFTWLDLNDMLIGFQPPNSSQSQRHNYEVEVEVHDLYFNKSPAFKVQVSVRNADTNAPRVSWNMGLTLLEGQSRPIAWEQMQIVDNDNLDGVNIMVADGLQHGCLTLRGEKGFVFTVSDIQAGFVRYHHDDSDSVKDFIIFRITDDHHQTQHKFPIKVLPKDDSPPFLITNTLIEAREGQMALISGSSLQASDMDSSNDHILFNITCHPQAGVVMKIPGPGLTGYPINHFLQKDLSQSTIYYHHKGRDVFDDFFEVVLSDVHDPPNLSESQIVMVHIEPVLDHPIREVPGSSRCVVVKETDVVHITRQQLHFSDQVSLDSDLTYTVTRPPFYTSPHDTQDAGRLFSVDSIPTFVKDSKAPVLRQFTQHAVNFMKVAFMPPVLDIGPSPQNVQLILSVTNPLGKTLAGICLNITVLPVDNQPPQVVGKSLVVDEGGEGCLTLENVLVSDLDSPEEALQVQLSREPHHGALWLDDLRLKSGHVLTLQDLSRRKVRYKHDGSETTVDDIECIVTDGTNSVRFIQKIKVNPVNDEIPALVAGLKPVLGCDEGQEAVITAEFIWATDADSDNSSLAFLIARQPRHGVVLRSGIQVDCFLQADITAGSVRYKHTGAEVELTPRHDTISFVISDEQSGNTVSDCSESEGKAANSRSRGRALQQVYDLEIIVHPVNSQPPSVSTGDTFVVDEGGCAPIASSHLKASDVDTVLAELVVNVISAPQFGYIENDLPSPGFEKRNTGISVSSFPYGDIINGHINYVQSRHHRLEPTADRFTVSVSDGEYSSAHVTFYIIIEPTNDEVPELVTQNITVAEGQMKQLDATVFQAVDLDVPKNALHFSVLKVPQHGRIISCISTRLDQVATRHPIVMDFTMADIANGMTLMYVHDDSETLEDSFTILLTDGKHQVQGRVTVQVVPVNDEEPSVIRNNGLEVEPGRARLISSATLFANDIDTPSTEVMYIFKSVPSEGLLQLKEGHDWVALSAGRNCSQESVDMNLLRYLHRKQHSAKTEDFFTFYLLDGKNRSPAQNFSISVKRQEKGSLSIWTKAVTVSRGGLVVLTTDVLFAEDGTAKPREILYAITKPAANGHVGYITSPRLAIDTFSQMDVAASRVVYQHDAAAGSASESLHFLVSNGRSSQEGRLDIEVTAVDPVPSSLSLHRGLPVPQGSTVIIDPDSLAMSITDSPLCALTFALQQPPSYGQLLLKGAALSTGSKFTQENVDALDVSYKHDGGPSLIDHFTFTSSDRTAAGVLCGQVHTTHIAFIIQILPLGTVFPEVVKLLPLWRSEPLGGGQHGIFVTSRELRARDPQGRDEDLTFCITRPPYFGHLKNISSGALVQRCFLQSELKKRALAYVIHPDRASLTDSLEFTVSDVLGNTGAAHRLEFRWSSVDVAQSHYSACEEQETLALDIIRQGNLAESSFVTVKVKEGSAEAGKDFLVTSAALVQFDPGVSKKIWRVEVLQDDLEEATETFAVILSDPEGAVLGSIKEAQVAIMETDRGCPGGHNQRVRPLKGAPTGDPGPRRVNVSMPRSGLELTKKKRRVSAFRHPIAPSSLSSDGTDTVYTYHGIMGVRLSAGTTVPRKSRKENKHLFSRPGQRSTPPAGVQSGPRQNKNKQRKKLNRQKKTNKLTEFSE